MPIATHEATIGNALHNDDSVATAPTYKQIPCEPQQKYHVGRGCAFAWECGSRRYRSLSAKKAVSEPLRYGSLLPSYWSVMLSCTRPRLTDLAPSWSKFSIRASLLLLVTVYSLWFLQRACFCVHIYLYIQSHGNLCVEAENYHYSWMG